MNVNYKKIMTDWLQSDNFKVHYYIMADEWYSDSYISIMQDHSIEKQMALLDHKVNGVAFYYFIIGLIEQAKAVLMSAVSPIYLCWITRIMYLKICFDWPVRFCLVGERELLYFITNRGTWQNYNPSLHIICILMDARLACPKL